MYMYLLWTSIIYINVCVKKTNFDYINVYV